MMLLLVFFLTGKCYSYDKDKSKLSFDIGNTAYYTYVTVRTLGIATAMYPDISCSPPVWRAKKAFFQLDGSGSVIAKDYVLTAAHVVKPQKVQVQDTGVSCFRTRPFNIVSRMILIFDYRDEPTLAKIKMIDTNRDIAILHCQPNNFLIPFTSSIYPYKSILESGDIVAIPVHVRDENGEMTEEITVRWGTIISSRPVTEDNDFLPWFSLWDFTLDVPVLGGDSGSPVFAFYEGEPFLIGVARAGSIDLATYYSYATWAGGLERYLTKEK